jgi:anti-sigma factor RsiW
MNCTDCRPILHAYVDDELDVRASIEMEAHLSSCAECAMQHRALRQLSQAVRVHASRFRMSPEFEDRLHAALRGAGSSESAPVARRVALRTPAPQKEHAVQRRAWLGISLAAALALGWIGGVFSSRPSAARELGDEIVAAHVRSLLGDHLTDVTSTDRHTVNPWFQGKVPFAPGARDFAVQGFALIGARLDYVDGRTVAALVYRHGPHAINVFVWPSAEDDRSPQRLRARGYGACRWVQGGLDHWAVSDVDETALMQLVDLVRNGT